MKYPLQWISAFDPANARQLAALANRMAAYYRSRPQYYTDIAESESLWTDPTYLPYIRIKREAEKALSILEIGCGRSALLKHFPFLAPRYTGLDFSADLMVENRQRYPEARFTTITDPVCYDLQGEHFDLVFSVFVIEHTVFPNKFLDECIKFLRPGGTIIVLAPNYLDRNWMPSQQTGPGVKSGRELLASGDLKSAFRALYYNKLVIPRKCNELRDRDDKFFININPLCFVIDIFRPDVDATYVTSEMEIKGYLAERDLQIIPLSAAEDSFVRARRLLLTIATKKQ